MVAGKWILNSIKNQCSENPGTAESISIGSGPNSEESSAWGNGGEWAGNQVLFLGASSRQTVQMLARVKDIGRERETPNTGENIYVKHKIKARKEEYDQM